MALVAPARRGNGRGVGMRSVPPSRYPVTGPAKKSLGAAASAARRRSALGSRATLETLESRVLLSTYYVATDGSDTDAGSLDNPFRTIQRAADLVGPGDTVLIR